LLKSSCKKLGCRLKEDGMLYPQKLSKKMEKLGKFSPGYDGIQNS